MNVTDEMMRIDETLVDGFRPGYSSRLIHHLSHKLGWSSDLSRRALRDAVRFLVVSAVPPSNLDENDTWKARVMISSQVVDAVVDEIFLNTPLLTWFETEVVNVRMYHVPSYEHGRLDSAIMNMHYRFSIAMMLAAGYEIDEDIWPAQLADSYEACIAGGGPVPCHVYAR